MFLKIKPQDFNNFERDPCSFSKCRNSCGNASKGVLLNNFFQFLDSFFVDVRFWYWFPGSFILGSYGHVEVVEEVSLIFF